MRYSDEFRRCLEQQDVAGVRALWAQIAPGLPQPANDAEALATIHSARTQARSIVFKYRAYSHRWLTERGLPSGLPDYMRPRAERMYPRIVEAVGIAVKTPPHRRELGNAIREAMGAAVMECYADGKTDPVFMRARMQQARTRILKG